MSLSLEAVYFAVAATSVVERCRWKWRFTRFRISRGARVRRGGSRGGLNGSKRRNQKVAGLESLEGRGLIGSGD